MMGRKSLSPILQRELEKNLDAGVTLSEGWLLSASAEHHGLTISLNEVDHIMETIIRTLKSSSEGSFPLHHQSCSKAVAAIARYGMGPATPDEKKRHIIHSLAKPLSDCLLATQETVSSGAALCLKSLVDSENWRFASNETINEVCQTVSGALEMHEDINHHMALVMSLAKHNGLLIEAYARLLVRSALHVLSCKISDEDSRERLLAILMLSCLMRYLDPRSILSEMGLVIEQLAVCVQSSTETIHVRKAAFDALQLAKRIFSENVCDSGDDSTISSPISMSMNRSLLRRYENDSSDEEGLVDDNNVSLSGQNAARYRRCTENWDKQSYLESSELKSIKRAVPKNKGYRYGSYTQNRKRMWWGFLILVVIFSFLAWEGHRDGLYDLVPT
ncbi:unnamed protein product [Cuscuta epithymum]|uniref:Uncharacterized protein n=1 Tax=Cuscuta epithymum TaxID=186058 RepID=A0AAV0EW00_9ASTE|nr:unnamed protein product [Cuscuta epithymum]